jgi:hypothetical protein
MASTIEYQNTYFPSTDEDTFNLRITKHAQNNLNPSLDIWMESKVTKKQ